TPVESKILTRKPDVKTVTGGEALMKAMTPTYTNTQLSAPSSTLSKNSHPLSSMLYSMGIREKYVKAQLSLRNKTDLSKEQYSVLRTNNPDEVEELEQKFVRAFEFSPAPTVRSSFLTKLRMIGDNLANTPMYGLNKRGELGLIKSAEFFENER